MNANRGRLNVPEELRDTSKWPCPEEGLLEKPERYFRLKMAIQLRISGDPYSKIFRETGVLKCEVIRQIRRCITESIPGHIAGFFALLPHARVSAYRRSAPVRCDLLSGSAGATGALEQFFKEKPQARRFIHRKFFAEPDHDACQEVCITYANLHREFIDFIKTEGVGPLDWPLSTAGCGYKSLRKYCEALINDDPERWLRVRMGKKVAWKAKIGRGISSLFDFHEPFLAVQLDYLMCDSAGVIHLKDGNGLDHAIVVKRWYLGLLADTRTTAVFGCYMSFEINPSTDCALATVSSVFEIESHSGNKLSAKLMPDGKSLMVSLVPNLRFLVWAVLQVDNGWCNTADDFVNNVIDATGSTVMFSTKRAWFQHAVVERLNGDITRLGMQRLLATYGARPDDPRRKKPGKAAIEFDIEVEELHALAYANIRDHNLNLASESNFGKSRVEVFEHLLTTDYLPQMLPAAKKDAENLKLLWHCEDRPIKVSRERGERPKVNVDYCKYTCPKISSDFTLDGQRMRVWINRRDFRNAYGVLLDDKRSIGPLLVEKRWSHYALPYQVFKLIQRHIHSHRNLRRRDDPVAATYEHLKAKALNSRRRGSGKHSGDALPIKVLENAGVGSAPKASDSDEQRLFERGKAFGLLKRSPHRQSTDRKRSRFVSPMMPPKKQS
jgi:hypothetical protein